MAKATKTAGKFEAGNVQEDGDWAVFDSIARQIDDKTQEVMPRAHEPRLGHIYKLRFDLPCFMPESDARVFLKDPAFIVQNAEGDKVPPLSKQAQQRVKPTTLEPNMVIADLNELTTDALLTRAAQRQGGQKFSRETRREALIRFLLDGNAEHDHATAPHRAAIAAPAGDDVGVEDMEEDGEDAARILEGA